MTSQDIPPLDERAAQVSDSPKATSLKIESQERTHESIGLWSLRDDFPAGSSRN